MTRSSRDVEGKGSVPPRGPSHYESTSLPLLLVASSYIIVAMHVLPISMHVLLIARVQHLFSILKQEVRRFILFDTWGSQGVFIEGR